MKEIKEKFKAVEFMRKQREALSKLHKENPEVYRKQLEEIKKNMPQNSKKRKNTWHNST